MVEQNPKGMDQQREGQGNQPGQSDPSWKNPNQERDNPGRQTPGGGGVDDSKGREQGDRQHQQPAGDRSGNQPGGQNR
jgi:hypothetical protein